MSEPSVSTQPPAAAPAPVREYVDRAFDAFVQSSMPLWIRFAHVEVGERRAAEMIACEIAFQLHETWEHVLQQHHVPSHAMNLLRSEIIRWRAEHAVTDQVVANAAFQRTMREGHGSLAVLAESIGAFSAIARLPERQHQVVLLRYALGCGIEEVAHLMDISPAAVATQSRHARRALAQELGIDLDDEENRP